MRTHLLTLTRILTRAAAACCVLGAVLASALTARAQSDLDAIPDRGFQSAGSYSLSDIETINTTNGNLSLQIPLASLPQGRGGNPGFTLQLLYNSKIWDSWTDVAPDPTNPSRTVDVHWVNDSEYGGWRYNLGRYFPVTDNRNNHYESPCPPTQACGIYIWKLRMHYPDGSLREFRPVGHNDYFGDGYYSVAPGPNRTYYSTDGSYTRLEYDAAGNWTLFFPDGTRIVNPPGGWQRTYDRNDNYTELQFLTNYNGTGHDATRVVDQMGRSVTVEFNGNEDYVHSTGPGGTPLTTTVRWKTVYVRKTYNARTHFTYLVTWNGYGLRVVDQIILPSQAGDLRYTFGYNAPSTPGQTTPSYGWGEVSSVTLPTGAQASYQYDMDGQNGGTSGAALFVTYKAILKNSPTRKDLNYTLEYDGTTAPAPTQTWLYSTTATSSRVTAPDGGVTEEFFGSTETAGVYSGRVFKTKLQDGTVVERVWQENRPGIESIPSNVGVNMYVKTEFTTIPDAGGTLVRTAIKDFNYDKNGNVLRVGEYDWVDYSSLTRDSNGKLTIPYWAPLKRETVNTYHVSTPDASATWNGWGAYQWRGSPRLLRTQKSIEVGPGGGQRLSRTEFFYDNATTTGNLTQQKNWDSAKGVYSDPLSASNSISTSFQYDAYGNLTLSTDTRGIQTQFTLGNIVGFTDLYPTEVKTAFGTPRQRTLRKEYDLSTGLITRSTDVDNDVSTATSYDPFGRPTLVKAAEGKPEETWVAKTYSDVNRSVIVRSDLNIKGDGKIVSISHYDQLGRVRLVRQLENAATQSATDETAGIKTQTRYVVSGGFNYELSSQPYRAATSGTAVDGPRGWSRKKIDGRGRLVDIQTFQGNALPAPWGGNAAGSGTVATYYDAEFTTVTDQAGKVRRKVIDALGQIVRIDEPDAANNLGLNGAPVQPTSYTYNALLQLTQVTQDTQTRTYQYSSLSRLTSVSSPESGTISFTHDDAGHMLTRTDARGITTTYTYDELGRNRTVDYSNTSVSPDIERYYDGATYGKGRFWTSYAGGNYSVGSNVEHVAIDAYDAVGRPKSQRRVFKTNGVWGANFTEQRAYDLAGNVRTLTYPSERTVSYGYDEAGRLNDFRGNLGDNQQRVYATGFLYDEQSRRKQEQFGTSTPVYNKHFYNNSGQLNEIRVSTYSVTTPGQETNWNRGALINRYSNQSWSGTGTDNNGNLLLQMIYLPNDDQINGYMMNALSYAYDSLNRLDQVEELRDGSQFSWRQDYDYDRWGNRTINASNTTDGIPEPQFETDTGTNRISAPGDAQRSPETKLMRYDAAGNLVYDVYAGQGTREFDAENRMTSAQDVYGQVTVYTYDADGRRTRRKVGGGAEVLQIYGMGGELLAEYAAGAPTSTPQREYGYRGGELLVTAAPAAAPPAAPNGERKNMALPSNGGVASASTVNPNHSLAAVNNGDRRGPGYGGIWADTTSYGYPDWVQIDFNGAKAVDEVAVFSLQDNGFTSPVAEPTATMTGSQYVVTSFDVQYWTGSQWATVPGGSVTGNNLIWRRVTFPEVTTTKVRVSINATGDNYSQVPEVEVWGRDVAPARANHALSSNGATAAASSQAGAGYPAAAAIDGDRRGLNWAAGGGWADGTSDAYPDWLEVSFGGERRVDEVSVVGLQESYANPSEPTEAMTGRFALTDFRMEYWTGSAWASVPGGVVTGNDRVWRRLSFPEVLTTKVRVWVMRVAGDNHSEVVELEAWGPAEATADIRWVVTDQLGTPRMVIDQTGSLGGMKRHDYFPFGEEMWEGLSGRSTLQGYGGVADGVRQKFAGKEHDGETGLDYSVHRYYARAQGRFTTADPIFITRERTLDPQTLNLYAYARNNPFRFTDPNGLYLRLVGNSADIMKYLEELERTTGLKLKYDPATGQVELDGELPANLSANAQEVANLIRDPNNHVQMSVINDPQGNQPVVIGRLVRVDSRRLSGTTHYITRHVVDLADVNVVVKAGNTTAGDLVIHETVEAYRAAKRGSALLSQQISQADFSREVHNAGIGAENNNRGNNRPARTTKEGFILSPLQYGGQPFQGVNGERFYYIDFTTHVEILTIDASGNKVLESNVVKK